MVHRRRDRYACGHLVVEQPADLLPQGADDLVIGIVIRAARVAVNAAGQVSFERFRNLLRLSRIGRDDKQRTVTERFRSRELRKWW